MNTVTGEIHLIFSGWAWQALRPLLLAPGGWAVGKAAWRRDGAAAEILVEWMEISPQTPRGDVRRPLEDWCVVCVDPDQRMDLTTVVGEIRPARSQRLAVVLLRPDDQPPCQAAVYHNDRLRPLDEIRVSGQMPRLTPRPRVQTSFDPQAEPRWIRTSGAVGRKAMSRLRGAEINLVGGGRLGGMMAFGLASLGAARLRLADGDLLAMENLDAAPGLLAGDVGRPKVEALAERLCGYRPDLSVAYVAQPLPRRSARRLLERRADLIVTCVDHDTPRLAVAVIARKTLTPHLDIGASIQHGSTGEMQITADVRLLLPGQGCVACVGGVDDLQDRLYDIALPDGALQRGRRRPWNEERAGSLISINSMAVGIALQCYLEMCRRGLSNSVWHRLRWEEGALRVEQGAVTADAQCRFCGNM